MPRPRRPSILAVDTETTGIDLHHGSKPFFVTMSDVEGNQQFWEVDVDPLTREPQWTKEDLNEIDEEIQKAEELVLHNAKFDVKALWTLRKEFGDWRWDVTHDTLIAAHLLASNQPHDLTTCTLVYLGINIKPLEDRLKEAINEARRHVRSNYPEWNLGKAGAEGMPSVKGSGSQCDYWLPRAVAQAEDYPSDHPWWTVLRDYSNADTACTAKLYEVMRDKLQKGDLWEIYLERMKCIPVAFAMEQSGVTVSGKRLRQQQIEYAEESQIAGDICVSIAADMGHELELPKSGNNKSLLTFCFARTEEVPCKACKGTGQYQKGQKKFTKMGLGVERLICEMCEGNHTVQVSLEGKGLNLPTVVVTGTGNPSLNKEAMDEYLSSLPEKTPAHDFLKNLRDKRKRDTALMYMEGYQRFWLPYGTGRKYEDWYVLHPSLNPTGTDTLRWSSSSPNEQNISKTEGFNLRYSFGPAPGKEWWSLDYQNIELRIPAYESGEEKMIELFERPDDPPYFGSYHLLNASIIYPDLFKPLANEKGAFKKKYNATWYQWCKNAGFALIYGCGEGKFDATCKREGGYATLKQKMPKLFGLAEKWIAHANDLGYVETIPDKTVNPNRGYPVYCTRSRWGKVSPTIPLNYHVQSTAMWCTMKAMIRVNEYLSKIPGARIVMQVHDELVIELPFKDKKRNLPIVRKVAQLMRKSGDDIGIPLTVGIEYHKDNWSVGESCH